MSLETNGHTVPTALPRLDLGTDTDERVGDSERVAALRRTVADRQAEQALHGELAALDAADTAADTRSEPERAADRKVAEKVRAAQRRDRLRAGLAGVRTDRARRVRTRWDEKATATRDRILDPARAVGADHRRWIASTVTLYVLLAGGVAWLAATVHDGLVGVGGSVLGYAVEPMASLLLVVSLLAQHTARQRGQAVARGFLAFDGFLLSASLLLNTLPWGARYGFDPASLTGHLLAPVLLAAVVIGLHLTSGQYAAVLTRSRPSERETACTALLQAAYEAGEVTDDTSIAAARRWLADRWPEPIGQAEARSIIRAALGR